MRNNVDVFKYSMLDIPKPKEKRKVAVVTTKNAVENNVAKLLAEIAKKRN